MESAEVVPCGKCGARYEKGAPFCPECGALSPGSVSPGPVAVEVDDVASENIRRTVVSILKTWFPELDSIKADRRLKAGRSILMKGISEDSGSRIVDALKALKVGARLVGKDSWLRNLFNGGLIVSGVALFLTLFFGPLFGFFLFLVAVGAPLLGAFLRDRQRQPLVNAWARGSASEKWANISRDYSAVISRMGRVEAGSLKAIARSVFDLSGRLSRDSLASIAAGEDTGELHARLEDILHSAVALGRRITVATAGDAETLKRELGSLEKLAGQTAEWFRSQERRQIKSSDELSDQLTRIRESIDAIMGEVSSPQPRTTGEKTYE
jgi:hypothetical protein